MEGPTGSVGKQHPVCFLWKALHETSLESDCHVAGSSRPVLGLDDNCDLACLRSRPEVQEPTLVSGGIGSDRRPWRLLA
jgi:hypothetical protein